MDGVVDTMAVLDDSFSSLGSTWSMSARSFVSQSEDSLAGSDPGSQLQLDPEFLDNAGLLDRAVGARVCLRSVFDGSVAAGGRSGSARRSWRVPAGASARVKQ